MLEDYLILIGEVTNVKPTLGLRPVISLDLNKCGYNLKKIINENGTVSFRLTEKE